MAVEILEEGEVFERANELLGHIYVDDLLYAVLQSLPEDEALEHLSDIASALSGENGRRTKYGSEDNPSRTTVLKSVIMSNDELDIIIDMLGDILTALANEEDYILDDLADETVEILENIYNKFLVIHKSLEHVEGRIKRVMGNGNQT